MAHFAQIENNVVTQVIVVNNEEVPDEATGVAFCKSLYGQDTQWVQTSYNNNFRGKYANPGDNWDGNNFISPTMER